MKRFMIVTVFLLSVVLPALAQDGPSLPPNLEPITAENVGRVEQIAGIFGHDEWPAQWSEDGQIVYLRAFEGTLALPMDDLAHPYRAEGILLRNPAANQPDWGEAAPDPITTSTDGRFIVHHESVDDTHAILHVIDSQTQQEIKTITADNSMWPRNYSMVLFMPRFFENGLLFLRDNALYRWNPANDMETLLFSCDWADIFFSPDGHYAATAELNPSVSGTSTFRIWNLSTSPATLLLVRTKPPSDTWDSITFSPDGRFAAVGGSYHNVRVWDVTQPDIPYQDFGEPCESCASDVVDLAYSANGRYLAGAYSIAAGGRVFLRDASTGEVLATIRDVSVGSEIWSGHWNSVAFHPTDNVLAFTAWNGVIWFWDIDTLIAAGDTNNSTAMRSLTGHTDAIQDINFSADGSQLVTASYDHTVRLWDYRTGETIRTLESHTSPVLTAVFEPQGRRIATMDGRTVYLWDVQTGDAQMLMSFGGIIDLAFSPVVSGDQEVLSVLGYNGSLFLLTLDPDGLQSFRFLPMRYSAGATRGAISPDGRLIISAGNNTEVLIWGVPAE